MDKPLKDWTLGEAKNRYDNCNGDADCPECPFYSKNGDYCMIASSPDEWDLSDPPRWTEQEVEDAKMLLRAVLPNSVVTVQRNGGFLRMFSDGIRVLALNNQMFPSIKDGETVKLTEIAGCEDDG